MKRRKFMQVLSLGLVAPFSTKKLSAKEEPVVKSFDENRLLPRVHRVEIVVFDGVIVDISKDGVLCRYEYIERGKQGELEFIGYFNMKTGKWERPLRL